MWDSCSADQGKYDEALPYFTESMETYRRTLGDEHLDTLTSINNMGSLLKSQGKYDEALPYFSEALETRRRTLGDEHPDTLASINNIGDLLTKQGKYDEALPYMQESIQFNLQNSQNPKALHDAAWYLADAGLPPAWFEKLADDCLAASRRSCELTNYQVPMFLDTLARVHFERGELDEAIQMAGNGGRTR